MLVPMRTFNQFYRILGIAPTDDARVIRDAYHLAAKKNHPDLFPEELRHRQQLRMMRINEAYLQILSVARSRPQRDIGADAEERARSRGADDARERSWRSAAATRDKDTTSDVKMRDADAHGAGVQGAGVHGSGAQDTTAAGAGPGSGREHCANHCDAKTRDVGFLKDPAYVYYKLGITYYGKGRETFFDRYEITKERTRYLLDNRVILKLAISCLGLFQKAYEYFSRVVDDYPDSIWRRDAQTKMYYLERYNAIYQRICRSIALQLHGGSRDESRWGSVPADMREE